MPERFAILGVGRTELSDEEFRARLVADFAEYDRAFLDALHYQRLDTGRVDDYPLLATRLSTLDETMGARGNYLFYLATPPNMFEPIARGLAWCGLHDEERGWRSGGVPAAENGAVGVDRPGLYAFFADSIPPLVKHVARERRPEAGGFFRPTALYAAVEETGCGVDPRSAPATVDGAPAVCEWDDIRGRLYILLPADRPGGTVTVDVTIGDRAGNRGEGRFGLTLEPAAGRMR